MSTIQLNIIINNTYVQYIIMPMPFGSNNNSSLIQIFKKNFKFIHKQNSSQTVAPLLPILNHPREII